MRYEITHTLLFLLDQYCPTFELNWTVGPSVDKMSAPKTTEIFYMKTGVNNN